MKKISRRMIVAIAVLLPVLYVLSYGAWIRLSLTGNVPGRFAWVGTVFDPVTPIVIESPDWVQTLYGDYLRLWLKGTALEWLQ